MSEVDSNGNRDVQMSEMLEGAPNTLKVEDLGAGNVMQILQQ